MVLRLIIRLNSQLIAESILKNNDTKASEVMRHYAIDQSWYELWKAFEIIEDDVERAVMVINKWASKKEMGAFAKSAQYHRHTTYSKRVRGIRPDELMHYDEARKLLRRIILKWMEHRKLFRIISKDGKYSKQTYLVFGTKGYLLTHEFD